MTSEQTRSFIRITLLILGFCLLILNIIGLFMTLRSADIQEKGDQKKSLSIHDIYDLAQADYIDRASYLKAMNQAVHEAVLHDWDDKNIDRFHLRVPVWENYILWILSHLYPSQFQKYEFTDYEKAIERGVGICSQHVIILDSLLDRKGIESRIVRLSGHVVATAKVADVGNIWWILDPDFGVVIENNLNNVEKDPSIIEPFYLLKGYSTDTIGLLMNIFGPSGNSVTENVRTYVTERYWTEQISYILIWVIPLLCMYPYCIFLREKTKR